MSKSAFIQHSEHLRTSIDAALKETVEAAQWPESLKVAVEYSLMAGGKRLRPILVMLASEISGGQAEDALPAACAIEMIHTYSLIHDDLPSMDNDDFRRGRPTSHKVFGEALAILAGDGLLTLAFQILSQSGFSVQPVRNPENALRICEMTRILAMAAGGVGMVGGQVLDLEAERGSFLDFAGDASAADRASVDTSKLQRPAHAGQQSAAGTAVFAGSLLWSVADDQNSEQNGSNQTVDRRVVELSNIHRMKTGALIEGAMELGAVSASAGDELRSRLRHYGRCIGLAFQIADDLLDVTGEQVRLGKTPGRDADLGKLTYPGLLGIEQSRKKAQQLVEEACHTIDSLGDRSVWLKELARFIVDRDH